MKQFSGMYAAIPTPFQENGTLNEPSLQKLCEKIVESGMNGILVCGSTGEYPYMEKVEKQRAISLVHKIVNQRAQVIAGCSCHNQADTIEMVLYAESIGVDMALVLPPYYLQTTEEGIYQYYKSICEQVSGIGIVIYHYPSATNVELSVEFIKRLSELPHIVGIKNTTEMEHTSKLIGAMRDNQTFGIVNGYEHLIMGTLTSGGDGTMGIIHALAPEQMMELYNAVQNNDLKTAMAINDRMRPLYTLMEKEPCPAPIKAALSMLEIDCGDPRKPLLPASNQIKHELSSEMAKAGLL